MSTPLPLIVKKETEKPQKEPFPIGAPRGLLRLSTAGSVDDGKSTLIGRLFHDAKCLMEDQILAMEKQARMRGKSVGRIDFAALTDGLKSEQEQGITIDVAYRYFSTPRRSFILADTPGHEQYTRNMVTGASTADCAIVLVDARNGITNQTRRHTYLVSLLGIRKVAVAVNKMDLVGYSRSVFEKIRHDFRKSVARLDQVDFAFFPLSALAGDGIVDKSDRMPWYEGPPLLQYLEELETERDCGDESFRFPVQYVIRPNQDFRGFAGQVASGSARVGDPIRVLPSGRASRIKSITTFDGPLESARSGMSVSFTLEDEVDVGRGDILVKPGTEPVLANRFTSHLVWLSEKALVPGQEYLLKHGTRTTKAAVSAVRYKIEIPTFSEVSASGMGLNEIGLCEINVNQALAVDGYARNRRTGSFILIDPVTNNTVAAGMIGEAKAGEGRKPKLPGKRESLRRSFAKTVSWRLCASLTTSTLVFGFSGKLDVALTIGGIEAIAKLALYFVHERLWSRIAFGEETT